MQKILGILVGGGPAPGINGVINAAALAALDRGFKVLGIYDGFEHLIAGTPQVVDLSTYPNLGFAHYHGGSLLRTSRANPTKDADKLSRTIASLRSLGVTHLVTIGGDDTAFSASRVAAGSDIKVVHIPKTIDNDLPLPGSIPTFGFNTARHVGAATVKALLQDARTTSRWSFVQAMGPKAGHLAPSTGKTAAATLTVIPEDFPEQVPITLRSLTTLLCGTILKRTVQGKRYGVIVLAEGLVDRIDPADLDGLDDVERDEHGHIRYAELDFLGVLRKQVKKQLATLGQKPTIVGKDLGYELRCVEPIAYDQEYVRDLGFAAVDALEAGRSSLMITVQAGVAVPIPFAELLDPKTGKTKVRMVDPTAFGYMVAKAYMLRLGREDFLDRAFVEAACKLTGMTGEALREHFSVILERE